MERPERRWTVARVLDRGGMALIFAALFVALCLTVDNFWSPLNRVGLLLSVSLVGMVACTMLFCMASGDVDLSVESVVAFSGVLCAAVITSTGSVAAGIAAGVAAGGLVGLLNGVVIAGLGVNALIATLASMQIARGLAFIVSHGEAVPISQTSFFALGAGRLLGVPVPVWITVACIVLFGVLLHLTTFGRSVLAIGGNREAARLSGLPVTRLRVVIFTMQGLVAGFAGVVLAARLASGQPNTSQGFALDVISACVLGGVSLAGGVGTMAGVVVGVLMMGTVQNALNLLQVQTFYQYVVRGVILLLAVLFDLYRRRRMSRFG